MVDPVAATQLIITTFSDLAHRARTLSVSGRIRVTCERVLESTQIVSEDDCVLFINPKEMEALEDAFNVIECHMQEVSKRSHYSPRTIYKSFFVSREASTFKNSATFVVARAKLSKAKSSIGHVHDHGNIKHETVGTILCIDHLDASTSTTVILEDNVSIHDVPPAQPQMVHSNEKLYDYSGKSITIEMSPSENLDLPEDYHQQEPSDASPALGVATTLSFLGDVIHFIVESVFDEEVEKEVWYS